MTARIIKPQEKVAKKFRKFIKERYDGEEFPQFESTEEFFQYFFNTDLRLNDFKNMIGYVSGSDDIFKHVGQKVNPKTGQKCNYYKMEE